MLITYCPSCNRHRLGNVENIVRLERTEQGLVGVAPCPEGHLSSTDLATPLERRDLALAC
jgi:hypothetical protein